MPRMPQGGPAARTLHRVGLNRSATEPLARSALPTRHIPRPALAGARNGADSPAPRRLGDGIRITTPSVNGNAGVATTTVRRYAYARPSPTRSPRGRGGCIEPFLAIRRRTPTASESGQRSANFFWDGWKCPMRSAVQPLSAWTRASPGSAQPAIAPACKSCLAYEGRVLVQSASGAALHEQLVARSIF